MPTDIQEGSQTDYTSESGIDDATEKTEIVSETLMDQTEIIDTYQFDLTVKSVDDSSTKQEVSNLYDQQGIEISSWITEDHHMYDTQTPQISGTEIVDTAQVQVYEFGSTEEDDLRTTAEQTCHQQREELLFETDDRKSPLKMFQSETKADFDSQPQDNSVIVDEQSDAGFNHGGNSRKMGLSRRNKRKEFKDPVSESYHELAAEADGNTRSDESSEKTNILITKETEENEKCAETVLKGMGTFETSQTEEENVPINPFVCTSGSTTANVYSSPTIEQLVIDQSHYMQVPDEKLSILCSVTDTESNERDECTDQSRHTDTAEIITERNSLREQTEVECHVEQEKFPLPKEVLATNGEQHEVFKLSEVSGSQLSEDVVNKLFDEQIDSAQMEEVHQIDYTSAMESKSSLPTLPSAHIDSHPQSTEDETHTGLNPSRNRRKLGSSRKIKGRPQHLEDPVLKAYNEPEEEVRENASGDEAPKMTNMSSPTETARQEELKDLKDDSTFVATDITENVIEHAGYSTVKPDLMQSPLASDQIDNMHSILHHDDTVISRLRASTVLDQEEASQVQNTEPLYYDKDSVGEQIQVQQTDDVRETVGYVATEELYMEAGSSMDVQGPGQDEVGEKCEESTVVAPEQAVSVSSEGAISTAVDAFDNRQENSHSDHSENSQVHFQQKRRKMGSTRKSQVKKKQEEDTDKKDETKPSDFNTEAGVRSLDKMEEVEESPLTSMAFQNQVLQDTFNEHQPSVSVYNEGHELQSSSADLQSTECNVIPGTDNLMVLLPEQSRSHNEEVLNSVTFLKLTDINDGEINVDISLESTQPDDFTGTEMQKTSRRNRRSVNQLLPEETETIANTSITGESSESFGESAHSTLIDEGGPQSVQVIQNQDSDEQNPNNMNEGAPRSPNLNSMHRRRKMGSTRRNLGSRTQGEESLQKAEVVNEATEAVTNTGVVTTERGPGLEEKELRLHSEYKDDGAEQRKENVFETVEYGHVGESQLKPLVQQAAEEKPVSQDQPAQRENELTPNELPSSSPKQDTMSESTYGGRRRKMGSHRKSRGHQPQENQRTTDIEDGSDVSIKEESSIKAAEQDRDKPSHLEKISEAEESEKKPSSNVNISREHSAPVRENTPSQLNFLNSGVNVRGADSRLSSYNVVMIGDSSVGKTSFMKRAQSGKFSLDLPASVGVDSCTWNVVVDGKPVVLHLWDTAGQERFRSITRQIFHRAQAFLLMYDITSIQTFSAVSYWANCIQISN
ncbi:uncharacterized protein rab44 isoform X2 [Mugil cephalus]|uniref:uncharacterized protein rab44 isoform X2 n=1 Tax=Mugil cephalus TaxID=48193 RepID=UPI001FB57187|nr:uncharacterized protein rab44 isoform X2 [Mugil cephalus]